MFRLSGMPNLFGHDFAVAAGGGQAIARGKPAATFRVGGIPEWLEHGVTGFLVKPYDIKEMAQRIDFLLNNPAVAHEMGLRGRKRVEQDFNKDKHISALLETYRQVIDGRT